MTTFSRLVDDLVEELLRRDMRSVIAAYTNQTIREMHFRPNTNSPVFFDANRYEEELLITTDGTWLWSLPSATRYQDIEALYIADLGIYVPRKNPRVALDRNFQPDESVYWYRSGPQIALFGVGMGMTAKLSYFMYPPTLAYMPTVAPGERKIKFDSTTDSYVLIADGGVPTQAQLDAETHWVLQRWADTVKEGVRAKTWKRLGEMERTRMAFSSFESMRTSVWNAEASS